MKTNIHFIIIIFSTVFLLPHSSESQILMNGGFETWHIGTGGIFLEPNGWVSSNTSSSAFVTQAPGNTGVYSANLISVTDGSGGYTGGSVYQERYGSLGLEPSVSLTGYWKGNFTGVNNRINIYF